MTISLTRPSISQSDSSVRRNQAPFLDLSMAERYPPPDPSDPFAPLWVLRSRTSRTQLLQRQSICDVSNDGRRMSAFTPRYPAVNLSQDDVRGVVSDSEYAFPRQRQGQNRGRQRAHSMALLTGGSSASHEFPSTGSRYEWPSIGFNERSYSTTGFENSEKRTRALHTTSDTSSAQKKLSQILRPKKLSTLLHPHTSRVHKASISGPVLASAPPAMKTFSLTLQASITDPQSGAIAHGYVPRNHSASQLSTRVASYRPPPSPVESTTRKHFPSGPLPRSPLSNSVSHSAIIRISYPTPSTTYPQNIQDNAFVSPRPAPQPPYEHSPAPPLKSRKTPRSHGKSKKSKPLPVTPPGIPSEWAPPTYEQLTRAASLCVIAESGLRVTFGSLFEKQRTIIIFIRHFWCPLCQDYMSSVRSFVRPDVIKSLSILSPDGGSPPKLVIVSNGSQSMIPKYRQIFRMPFDMYTDPTLAVYTALGMGRSKPDADYLMSQPKHKEPTLVDRRKKDKGAHAGGYVKHGTVGGIVMVALRALKVGMPVWEKGGDVAQLGGEFVFGPGLTCSFAHRMQSPSGHAPIQDVVKAALGATNKTSAAKKTKKPLTPIVFGNDGLPAYPAGAVEIVEKDAVEDISFSYELVSNETHVDARVARDSYVAEEARVRERQQRRKLISDAAPSPDEGYTDSPSADNASVIVAYCDSDASEGSTMQLSPASDSDTLGETDQSDDERVHRENVMLDMHHAN